MTCTEDYVTDFSQFIDDFTENISTKEGKYFKFGRTVWLFPGDISTIITAVLNVVIFRNCFNIQKNCFIVAPKINGLNVQKYDSDASKKKALIQSFKKKVPLKVSFWCYTQTLSRKVGGSKSGHLWPFVEHSCVKLFEKIHIVLNTLFVAL